MDIHVGRGVGLIIERAILSAERRIVVCSPWISEKYAEILSRKAREGVEVHVVTSEAPAPLLRRDLRWLPLLFLSIALAALSIYTSQSLPLLLSAGLLTLSLLLLARRPVVDIHVPPGFVHAKIYVVDGVAYLSSANLTESGMHGNVEFVVVVDDPREVERIERAVLSLAQPG